MNANKALQMGFCDQIMGRRTEKDEPDEAPPDEPEKTEDPDEEEDKTKDAVRPLLFSRRKQEEDLIGKLKAIAEKTEGHSVDDILGRLETIKNFM